MFENMLIKASHVLAWMLDLNTDGKIDSKDAKVLDASIYNVGEYSRIF